MQILTIVAPVFLVVLLGIALSRGGVLTPGFSAGANRFVYWVGLPVLLFRELATASHELGGAGRLVAVMFATAAVMIALGYAVARLLRVRREAVGTFVHAGYRGNLAYVALPIIYALPAASGPDGAAVRTLAIVALAPTVLLFNATAVAVLVASRHAGAAGLPARVARETLRNPILLGCAAGMVWSLTDVGLPPVIERSMALVAQAALPLALLCIGAALAGTPLRGNRRLVAAASLLKVVVGPLVGYALARLAGLDLAATQIALILLATPSAAAGYTMVSQLGGDEALAAGTILVTTAASAAALAVVVAATAG